MNRVTTYTVREVSVFDRWMGLVGQMRDRLADGDGSITWRVVKFMGVNYLPPTRSSWEITIVTYNGMRVRRFM